MSGSIQWSCQGGYDRVSQLFHLAWRLKAKEGCSCSLTKSLGILQAPNLKEEVIPCFLRSVTLHNPWTHSLLCLHLFPWSPYQPLFPIPTRKGPPRRCCLYREGTAGVCAWYYLISPPPQDLTLSTGPPPYFAKETEGLPHSYSSKAHICTGNSTYKVSNWWFPLYLLMESFFSLTPTTPNLWQ